MGTTIRIAASNSSEFDKQRAEVICTGEHDQRTINEQIEKLTLGGTIQLLNGDYYIDAFESEGNSAICFGYNDGKARAFHFIGDTDNKGYNTNFGASIHVTKKALDSLPEGETGRVIYGTGIRPEAPGVFFTMTFINNLYFENFRLYLYDASKPVIGIDCSHFGVAAMNFVSINTEKHYDERYLHIKASTPVKGSVGVRSFCSSSDGVGRMGFTNVDIGGFYIGFEFIGCDHLILHTCGAARCCYGYVFRQSIKTLTMINNYDEGNSHLPKFYGYGQLTCIDFNIERFNWDHMPDDPEDYYEPYAEEEIPGGWHGYISYTMEGAALEKHHFWKEGHGLGFTTYNLRHERNTRPTEPEYLETYFDPKTEKTLTWTGKRWVDAMGNPVE